MYKEKFNLELDKDPISKRQICWNWPGIVVNLSHDNFLVCFLSLSSLTQLSHLSFVVVNNSKKHLKPLYKYSTEMATVPNAAEMCSLEQTKHRLKQGQYKTNLSCTRNQNNMFRERGRGKKKKEKKQTNRWWDKLCNYVHETVFLFKWSGSQVLL